jgi:hypothetical protein
MPAAQAQADWSNAVSYGPGANVTTTVVTVGPDGQPNSAPISLETAARVQAALGKVFGDVAGKDSIRRPELRVPDGRSPGRPADGGAWPPAPAAGSGA